MRATDRRGNSRQRRVRKTKLLSIFGNGRWTICTWCREKVTAETMHADRIVAGGSYRIENLIPACGSCNMNRKDKPVELYLSMCKKPRTAKKILLQVGALPTDIKGEASG